MSVKRVLDGMDTLAPIFSIQRARERATFNHGWLQTSHSFSFAEYYDPQNIQWGALRVFNDDTVAPGTGFGEHPHRNMEIVTYVLSGRLKHADSMGREGVVEPGGVQYMSAASGILHSEFNADDQHPVHFLQMWVMPERLGGTPLYGQQAFAASERTGKWLVVASGEPAVGAPIAIRAAATLRVARIEGTALTFDLGAERFGFLFVAQGAVEVDGESLAAGDAVRMAGAQTRTLRGAAEVVFWDVPPYDVRRDEG